MTRVKNFQGFMRSRLNESEDGYMDPTMSDDPYAENVDGFGMYGANPEDEEAPKEGEDDEDGEEEEEVTLESLKAMIEDLTERVEKLEGGGEEDGEEGDEEGGEEGEEAPAEAAPAK